MGRRLVFIVRRSVKYKFRNLTSLHASAVRAFRRALKLKRHLPDSHLAHALLPEIAQLSAVQYGRCGIERLRFNLNGIVEVDVERVA